MNYDLKVNELKERILKKEMKFSNEEKFLITNDDKLLNMFFDMLKSDVTLYNKMPSSWEIIFDEENVDILGDDILLWIFRNELNNNNFFCCEFFHRASKKTIDIMTHEIIDRLKSSNPTNGAISIGKEELMLLLDNECYDILNNITDSRVNINFNNDDITKILKDFPFDKLNFPIFEKYISNNIVMHGNELLNYDFRIFPTSILISFAHHCCNREDELHGIIDERLKGDLSLFNNIRDVYLYEYLTIKSSLNTEKRLAIYQRLLDAGKLDLVLYCCAYKEILTKDNINKIIDLILSGAPCSDMNRSFDVLYENVQFIEAIIKTGNLKLLRRYYDNITNYNELNYDKEKYIQLFIQEINKHNSYYELFEIPPNNFMREIFYDPRIIKAFIDNNNFSLFMNSDDYSSMALKNNDIREKLLDRILVQKDIDLKVTSYLICDLANFTPNILDELLFHKRFDVFIQLLNIYLRRNGRDVALSDTQINMIIEQSISDYSKANDLLQNFQLVFENSKLLDFFINETEIFAHSILEHIEHNDDKDYIYTDSVYNILKNYFCNKYELNNAHMDILKDKFGNRLIRFLSNDNIKHLVNSSDYIFNRFIKLFPDVDFTMQDMEMVYDSLKQYEFRRINPEVLSIFADIKHSLEDGNDEYIKLINKMIPTFDNRFSIKLKKYYPEFSNDYKSGQEFVTEIIRNLTLGNNVEKNLKLLHFITDYYIAIKREDYRDNYNMMEELKLPYKFDERDGLNKLVDFAIRFKFGNKIEKILKEKYHLSDRLAYECIVYFTSGNNATYKNDVTEIESNLKYVVQEAKKLLQQNSMYTDSDIRENALKLINKKTPIKKVPTVPEQRIDMLQILSELRLDLVEQYILNDEEIYQSLKDTIRKYKLHKLPDCFKMLMESENIQISGELMNIGAFISYYAQIYESEKKRLLSINKSTENIVLTIPNIFINADIYSSSSSIYSQILGANDSRLIKSNPGPNNASKKTINDERLKEAVEYTINNFRRKEVTIPTCNEIVTLSNGKQIRIIIGNFTHPSNLTHGERTGSCMRIGGVGESLFNFCLTNKNGFHIRFESLDGGYVSRVSGFRNGNSVFLNELRYSCADVYSNDDVVNACHIASKLLIDMSNESQSPINNVFLHNAYATKEYDLTITTLNISNIKEGLSKFYTDISKDVIVMATSEKEKKYATINLDKKYVPSYLPAREKSHIGTSTKELLGYINRVFTIKKLLSGYDYQYIESYVPKSKIIYGIANQDWYIYIDENDNVYEDLIDIDKRAKEELEMARKLIYDYKANKRSGVVHAI